MDGASGVLEIKCYKTSAIMFSISAKTTVLLVATTNKIITKK